jgi:hypothetical protein
MVIRVVRESVNLYVTIVGTMHSSVAARHIAAGALGPVIDLHSVIEKQQLYGI